MRNCGTFSANGQPQLVKGAITANDMQGFIARYKDNKGAFNMDILNRALDTLQEQAGVNSLAVCGFAGRGLEEDNRVK